MTWENIKTIILIVLIGTSLLLTFGLWSTPKYNQLTSSDSTVNEVNIGGGKNTKGTIIEPNEIIFHSNGSFYGFIDPVDRQNLFQNMKSWEVTDFEIENAGDPPEHAYMVELIFPDAIPVTLLGSFFQFSEDITFPSWSFRQIFITFISDAKSLKLHIPSIDGRDQATAYLTNTENYESLWEKVSALDEDVMQTYLPLEESPYPVYVPEGKVKLVSKSTTFNKIDPELLVNVLFTNPSAVSQSYTPEVGETYFTDGQRGLRVFEDGRKMEFVNPYSEEDTSMAPNQLLEESIYHINGHNGWTDEYHLMSIEPERQSIRYKMYHEGYPVFNSTYLATIEQVWGNQQLIEYHRPLFKLRDTLSEGTVQLPSGEQVLSYLRNNPYYELENVEQICVGYQLNYQSRNQYIDLEPAWYMEYNNGWRKLPLDQLSNEEGSN